MALFVPIYHIFPRVFSGFEFKVVHDPIDKHHPHFNDERQRFENYAHCEIRAEENGVELENEPPRSVRKKFRIAVTQGAEAH